MEFVKIPGTAFEMMTTPVTRGHWKEVIGNLVPGKGKFERSDEHPVESVAMREAEAFCERLNRRNDGYRYRLPTKAEWIHACKGGGTDVAYGPPLEIGWFMENGPKQTHPVGRKTPNAWGLYDMLGNVNEWTTDSFGRERIACGRSFEDFANLIGSLQVTFLNANTKSPTVGFRVIREVWHG